MYTLSSPSVICGQSLLPTPCARAFDKLVRAIMAEKRLRGVTGGKVALCASVQSE